MNVLERIPPRARIALYLVFAALGPVLVYTSSKGWTGEAEYNLWIGLGTAFGLTAAANVRTRQRIPAGIKAQPVHIETAVVTVTDKSLGNDPPAEPVGYGSGVRKLT